MATNFPGSLDNSTSLPYPTATSDTNSPSLAGGQDNQNDAVIATQTKLGIGSSTASSNNVLVGTGSGQSNWQLLTSSNVTLATGSGAFVFGTSPTITSPTLNTPTINNPTLKTDSIIGYTSASTGTVYGVSIASGIIASAALAGQVNTAALQSASVTPAKLATGAVQSSLIGSSTTTQPSYVSTLADSLTLDVVATIGSNGLALVSISAAMVNSTTDYTNMSFALSGANTQAASDSFSIGMNGTSYDTHGATFLLSGLSSGSTTFTAYYDVSGGTGTYNYRRIAVVPL